MAIRRFEFWRFGEWPWPFADLENLKILITGAAGVAFIALALKEGLTDKKTLCLGTFIAGWISAGAAYKTPDIINL